LAYEHNGERISRERFYAIACDPRRSVAVEACAGAGKTWMLVSRILRALLAEDLQPVLATDALIPAAKQEAGVVDVVVEVVVREEEVVHLRGPQAGFDELVRGRRAAVEHGKPAAAEVEDV